MKEKEEKSSNEKTKTVLANGNFKGKCHHCHNTENEKDKFPKKNGYRNCSSTGTNNSKLKLQAMLHYHKKGLLEAWENA